MVYFAKFCNESGRIYTGTCGLNDWAEQETSETECVVQTSTMYYPDELFLGPDYVLREVGTGNEVGIEAPLTKLWLYEVMQRVQHSEAAETTVHYAFQRLMSIASRDEARTLLDNLDINIEWPT